MEYRPLRAAARVAIIYAVVAALWILLSDRMVGRVVPNAELRLEISILKGWGFVAATALILFFSLRHELTRRARVIRQLEQYKALAENTQDIMLFIQEPGGRIVEANRAAVQAYGLPREALLQTKILDLRHETSRGGLSTQLQLASVQGLRFETVHRRSDGSPFPVEVTSQGLTIGQDRLLLSIIRDISERRAAEAEQQRLAEERDRLLGRLNELNAELEQRVAERTAELATAHEQLRALAHRRAEIQERERAYVADQLYNETAQVLALLQIQQGMLQRDLANGQALPERWAELKRTVDRVLSELHHLAVHLRPVTLDRLGLAAALEQYLAEFGREHGLKVEFAAVNMDGAQVPTEAATSLYRIVQEALANVAQHAGAGKVSLVVSHADAHILLVLEDDGIGFDVDETLRGGALGLIGMREQVDALHGCFEVESGKGSGTTVAVQVPLEIVQP
jgi:PAS domain S-box-containing protein